MKNYNRSSTSLFVMSLLFFCLAFIVMAEDVNNTANFNAAEAINKTSNAPETKNLSDWTINDLSNELRRHGEIVADGISHLELVQRMRKYINEKTEDLKESFLPHHDEDLKEESQKYAEASEDDKAFTDMTIGEMAGELKRHGEIVADGISKLELIKRLRKYFNAKTQDLKENFLPKHQEGEEDKAFTDMTIGDMANELRRYGESVSDGIQRTELIQRLKKYIVEKKDALKENFLPKHQEGEDKAFTDMSLSELASELKRYGESVSDGIQRTEMIQRLKKYIVEKKDALKETILHQADNLSEKKDILVDKLAKDMNTVSSKLGHSIDNKKEELNAKKEELKDFAEMSISDMKNELKRYGVSVSEGIQRSELVKKLNDFYQEQKQGFILKKDEIIAKKDALKEDVSKNLKKADSKQRKFSNRHIL